MSSPIDCSPAGGRERERSRGRPVEYDPDDEVFVDDPDLDLGEGDEGVELREKTSPPPRVRRVSDVIDSIGDMSPVHQHLMDAIQAMDGRRLSDPAGLQVRHDAEPSRHSDSFALNGSGRPKSILVDQGYGSSSTMSPFYLVHSQPPVPLASTKAKPANDTIDAQPYNVPSTNPGVQAKMPVGKESEEYNMSHPRRGKAVIFNHDTFNIDGLSPRSGSEVDVKNLVQTYEGLGFEAIVHQNLTFTEIKSEISKLSQEDFTDADCLCITVLTHGMGSNYLLAQDHPYNIDQLWTPFTADRCTTLAGKPKLFFIQACRGERLDSGVTLVSHRHRSETDSSSSTSYKIPTHADFLLAYSSMEGFFSWRNPEDGTWFIQCLCEELRNNAAKVDLLKLLTNVSRKVALDYQSYNDLIPWQHEQKQVPSVVSMLIRDVHLRPKN
ncbi:caspase-1-like [Thrips palmi]|uniref:Caspase-1-like n=1 Tax=Thrips palmi TaxID=161013 RepID=A0A6P8ZBP0_THRPL|nr:caspase-1-like [Thrips palmi]